MRVSKENSERAAREVEGKVGTCECQSIQEKAQPEARAYLCDMWLWESHEANIVVFGCGSEEAAFDLVKWFQGIDWDASVSVGWR